MKKWISVTALLSWTVIVGCSGESSKPAATSAHVDGSKYLLTSEPQGAQSVSDARKAGKNNEEIVLFGRIGGSESPWIDKRAAFSIVDSRLKACSDIEGDSCSTPWDYCCQTAELPTSTALIKVVDQSGKMVEVDARELLKVKELQTVVVKGKAQRDDKGNLTVLANGIYVKK